MPAPFRSTEQVPLMMALTSNEGVRVLVTGRKLLLADDSATIRKVVELTFSDEGLEVITVSDGQQALDKLDEIVPDIVLADVFMPEVNGYQVCEHIKQTERFRHIPVMLLVGSFEPFDEAEARRVGADDYLTKPFQSIRTLVGKVRGLLGGEESSSGSQEATTRRLAPLPESGDEANRPDEESIKRSTADTAPLPQHDQKEMPLSRDSAREGTFADLSMDDQMIEATPANGYTSSSNSDSQLTQDTHEEARPTAAYSAADLREAGIRQVVENAPAPEQEMFASSASRASNVASSDDALLDLGDIEPPPAAMTEADDFFLDLLDESPGQPRTGAPSFTATPEAVSEAIPAPSAEEMDAHARADYEEETAEATAPPQVQEFVEPQVLSEEPPTEFAPVEDEAFPVEELQPTEVALVSTHEEFSTDTQLAPTERLPDDFQAERAPAEMGVAESGATANASPVTGQITLEQLSPEVIDAIARRAVEQLSARVVEQIAWEVVPDLAELLIKRRLEEEKNNNQ